MIQTNLRLEHSVFFKRNPSDESDNHYYNVIHAHDSILE